MPDAPVLFYAPGTCAASEILAFEWAQIPYHLCRVTREQRKGDAFRGALNPNGQVPVLLFPDGRILSENAALLAWIGDQVPGKGLTPAFATPERYVFYFWLSWFDSTFHAAHTPLFAPGRLHPDAAQHEAIRAQAALAIAELLPRVERHLEGREFFFLERRTVLDGYVFAMGRWSEQRLDYATRFPRLAAFLDRMREDPAVQFLLALEKDENTARSPGGALRGHVAFQEVLASV
jgi:glutathione S-transferase